MSPSSRRRRRRGSRRGGGRRSFRGAGLAHAVENARNLGQMRRVVGHRRPGGAKSGDGEGRVERKTGLDVGTRLVNSAKLGKGEAQLEIWMRVISVGLDRPSKPRDRLLIGAEMVLRHARASLPRIGHRIARAEPQGLSDVSVCFISATDENLAQSDRGVGRGEISIEFQRMLTFGDALAARLVNISTSPKNIWAGAWSGTNDKALANFVSAAAKAATGSVTKDIPPSTTCTRAAPTSASTLSASANSARSKKRCDCTRLSGVRPLLYQAKP